MSSLSYKPFKEAILFVLFIIVSFCWNMFEILNGRINAEVTEQQRERQGEGVRGRGSIRNGVGKKPGLAGSKRDKKDT